MPLMLIKIFDLKLCGGVATLATPTLNPPLHRDNEQNYLLHQSCFLNFFGCHFCHPYIEQKFVNFFPN